ncbi:hypothetical protein MRB53_014244 [Persea americana]|uniref:Uncharacterized protein n=1 Tax=Persea americana TaxID=3435 RepID=A0ACC2KAX2_PERAE|nr:hypothetical protein MRB53_014244 [Persea americana]
MWVREYNFGHPDAFDTEQLLCCMGKLRHWQAVDIPNYDFKSYKNGVFPKRRVVWLEKSSGVSCCLCFPRIEKFLLATQDLH